MRTITTAILLTLLMLSASVSQAFDCTKLDFGAKLSDIDDGNFILYKTYEGVSYYNYVGPCKLKVHENANPAISYAFVDGKYYARIIRVTGRNKNDILKNMKADFGPDIKVIKRGVWTEYIAKFSEGKLIKFKYNDRTGEAKTATYSMELRKQLTKSLKNDPTN